MWIPQALKPLKHATLLSWQIRLHLSCHVTSIWSVIYIYIYIWSIQIPIFTSLLTNCTFFHWRKGFKIKINSICMSYTYIYTYANPVVTTVRNWCWPLDVGEGRCTVCRPNGRLSQRWFITGTVTECSWQRGHGSSPHRQTGHCYLAGRSELSLLISTFTPDESTTHHRISAQPGEKTRARLSFCTVSRSQPEEGFYELVYIFCNQSVWFPSPPVEGFQQVTVNWCVSQTSWWWLLLPRNRSKTSERNTS